ncbi:LysR family transcriptional regulator [Francisella tularensis]|uniref:LysR family transcriptional regulator n=1 Tax=Francisella tularensis TaxID=263 RepID=UPI001C0E9D14|nr:LysR family transcriptional regulator [Francisella tularensis]MBK2127733.1 LysR family transcriptional regulator [Francisella tularensis]MBK2139267.1 LysR family transcriptional regulator [Francisella tularensis]MBK2142346.1 LysR family transcriptional regulator [Francisella tularensis]MBK2143825.1 LysR family transcriptional regulator [Francisella tularensis]
MNKHKNISISLFEAFYQLVVHGSFTNTAKALGISKAAVSHTIKQLEKELKVDLLNRTTRSLSLTHEGMLLFNYCKTLQNEIDNIRDLAESFHKEPSGTLKISTSSFFAQNILINLIKEYSKKFSKVKIEVSIEEKMPNFKSNEADIILGVNWTPPENIVARKIATTRYVLCASPAYINKNGSPSNISDLANHNYIPHKSRVTPLVNIKKNKLNPQTLPSNISANNIEFIKACVLNDFGIAQFHEYIVKNEIQNSQLIELLKDNFFDQQDIYIYSPKNKFVQPKVKEFVNLVINSQISI